MKAWWCCSCAQPICRVGRGRQRDAWAEHLIKGCDAQRMHTEGKDQEFGLTIKYV